MYQKDSRVAPICQVITVDNPLVGGGGAQVPHIDEVQYLLKLGTTVQQLQDLIYAA